MKIITASLLVFLSCPSISQVKVQAENFAKASGVLVQVVESGIVGINNSYADYDISIPKSGTYDFDFAVSNKDGQKSFIYIKTPTGKKNLASIEVPEGQDQIISIPVKLTPSTKKIRIVFSGNGSVVNSFTYSAQGSKAVYALKSDYDKLKKSFDSLLIQYKKNTYYLDGKYFLSKSSKDSVIITLIDAPAKK